MGSQRMSKFLRYATQFALVAIAAIAAGCASIDFDAPKSESHALPVQDTQDTHLGLLVADDIAAHPEGQSGFYPVVEGIDSLALRLMMAERAEHTIDAQYFLIYDDIVGNAFANALLRAANRGVRVRFLLDDVLSKGLDPGLATLDSHENIEVRIFNPFAHRSARGMDIFGAFGRVTRRMHNKSFTVDNQITMVGGRNIAGEYFGARADENFLDLDLLAIGPVVPEVSGMFDTYWNHRAAVPMTALAEAPDNAVDALDSLEEDIKTYVREHPDLSKYAEALNETELNYVETNEELFTWSDYDLVYDSPDKSSADTLDESTLITEQMLASIGTIENELFVSTPYFVLLDEDIEWFRELRERGVDVTVLTNSLASNNHAAVHGAYSPSRKKLLKMGVNLYELRADEDRAVNEKVQKGDALSTLHAKAFAVDGKSLFIGSFNWNQRSVNRDTESGVIIHSPEMAAQFVDGISARLPELSFKLSLNESNDLRWTIVEDGQEVVATKEPQTGFWRRFSAWIQKIVPKSQL